MQSQGNNVDIDTLQIEQLFNIASWDNASISQFRFSSHGVSFLAGSALFYLPHPIPFGNILNASTVLTQNVHCYCSVENEGDLFFVIILSSGELAVCVLEEMLDIIYPRSESKSSLQLRLLHSMISLNIQLQDYLQSSVIFISQRSQIIFQQGDSVSIFKYSPEVVPESPISVLATEISMENEYVRKLLPKTCDEFHPYAIWKSCFGQVTLVGCASYSNVVHFISLNGLSGNGEGLSRYAVPTSHHSQISAISTSPNADCDYALTGDVDGCILLWKFFLGGEIGKRDGIDASELPMGKWEVILEEISFCDDQQVSFVFVDPRNLFAYIGDTGGRLSVVQISGKSNQMHLIHELYLFPITHGPTSVFIIPASSLPSSSSSYVYEGSDSIPKASDHKSVLVQCYCQTSGEAVQVHLNKGIACVMRVNSSGIIPCDRGIQKIRSERANEHATFPAQDTTTAGSAVIDRSIILPSLNIVVTVDWLGVVQLWDIVSGRLVLQSLLPSHYITCLVGSDGHCWKTRRRIWLCSGHQSGMLHAVSLSLDPVVVNAFESQISSVLEDKSSLLEKENAMTAAAAAANITLGNKSDRPVFDLLQEESDKEGGDDESEESPTDSEADDNGSEGGGSENEEKVGVTNKEKRAKRALAENTMGSLASDYLSSSHTSWFGKRNTGSFLSHLIWNVTHSARPSRLPVTDAFISDFGEQLVAVHAKQVLHLYCIDNVIDVDPGKTQATSTVPSGGTKHNEQDEKKTRSATASSSATASRRANQSRHKDVKSNTDESHKPRNHLHSDSNASDDFETMSNSDAFSVDSSMSNCPAVATPASAKRPLKTLKLDFIPIHITMLHRQMPAEVFVQDEIKKKKSRRKKRFSEDSTSTEYVSNERSQDDFWANKDRLWLVLQKSRDEILILDALSMEKMNEVKLTPIGQECHLRVTFVWDYMDRATLQCVMMGLCAVSPTEWLEFNELDGLKAVWNDARNLGGSFHQSTYSNVKSSLEDINQIENQEQHPFATSRAFPSMPSIVSQSPASILESEFLGVSSYRAGEAPIVVGWSHKVCTLVRLQLIGTNRVTVTRMKRYNITNTGLLHTAKRNRVKILAGKSLRSNPNVRNHRAVIVLSNGFAIVLHL